MARQVDNARARKQSGRIKTDLKQQQTSSFIGHSRCRKQIDGCPVTYLKQSDFCSEERVEHTGLCATLGSALRPLGRGCWTGSSPSSSPRLPSEGRGPWATESSSGLSGACGQHCLPTVDRLQPLLHAVAASHQTLAYRGLALFG